MKMRIVIGTGLLALAAVVGVVLATASDEEGAAEAHGGAVHSVVAAFYPLAFAAQAAGGPSVSVKNLTPPGAEPHDLELTPQDVRDIHGADLVLLMGHDFQPQLESAAGDRASVVRVLDDAAIGARPSDPHVWLDPVRFERMVYDVAARIRGPEPVHQLEARLTALDGEYRAGLSDCERHEIVTSHDAFGYLADRYGLEQVPISGTPPEAEPTPTDLEAAADAVRETGATTVFTETLASPKLSQTVARETGAKTAVLNPIEGLTGNEQDRGDDYFDLMRDNLEALREALGCR